MSKNYKVNVIDIYAQLLDEICNGNVEDSTISYIISLLLDNMDEKEAVAIVKEATDGTDFEMRFMEAYYADGGDDWLLESVIELLEERKLIPDAQYAINEAFEAMPDEDYD
jgi:hypothetical protein